MTGFVFDAKAARAAISARGPGVAAAAVSAVLAIEGRAMARKPQEPHEKAFRTAIVQPQEPQEPQEPQGASIPAVPTDPDEADLDERKALAIDRVPKLYLDAWAGLQCQKPMRVSDDDWRQAIDDAGRFLDAWGTLAVEFQWTPGELFDVPRHDERCGLVWFLKGETVCALGPAHAATESGRHFLRERDFDAGLLREGVIR